MDPAGARCEVILADDLVYTALGEAGRNGHVLTADAVAERPRSHLAVALLVAERDFVVHCPQRAHRRCLNVGRNMRNRMRRLEVLIGQEIVAMVSHRRRIIDYSTEPRELVGSEYVRRLADNRPVRYDVHIMNRFSRVEQHPDQIPEQLHLTVVADDEHAAESEARRLFQERFGKDTEPTDIAISPSLNQHRA